MRVLFTAATSPMAYHLIPLLASGDCFHQQKVYITLCDSEPQNDQLADLVKEVNDCCFSLLEGISVTHDFCESCKSADVVIYLSPDTTCTQHTKRDVTVSSTSLTQVDFCGLGQALHPVRRHDTVVRSKSATGPLSTAAAIADCITQIHREALETANRVKADIIGPQYLEGEAEFGCPPSQEATGYMVPCDNHLQIQPSIMGTGTTVMFVSAATTEDSLKDTNNKDMDHKCSSMLYARL